MSRNTWTPVYLEDQVARAQYESRPSGSIILNGQEVAHTLQCCHCNKHFVSIRGSGHIRGFCTLCGQITCGDRKCDTHIAWEKKLELLEKQSPIILPGQY